MSTASLIVCVVGYALAYTFMILAAFDQGVNFGIIVLGYCLLDALDYERRKYGQ